MDYKNYHETCLDAIQHVFGIDGSSVVNNMTSHLKEEYFLEGVEVYLRIFKLIEIISWVTSCESDKDLYLIIDYDMEEYAISEQLVTLLFFVNDSINLKGKCLEVPFIYNKSEEGSIESISLDGIIRIHFIHTQKYSLYVSGKPFIDFTSVNIMNGIDRIIPPKQNMLKIVKMPSTSNEYRPSNVSSYIITIISIAVLSYILYNLFTNI